MKVDESVLAAPLVRVPGGAATENQQRRGQESCRLLRSRRQVLGEVTACGRCLSASEVSLLRHAVGVAGRQGDAVRPRAPRAAALGPRGRRADEPRRGPVAAAAALPMPSLRGGDHRAASRRARAQALHRVGDRARAVAVGLRADDRRRGAVAVESVAAARREPARAVDDASPMGPRGA